jgi:hypothetical protein
MFSQLKTLVMSSMGTFAILVWCSPGQIQAQTWKHPGVLVSQAQLDATKAAYEAGDAVVVSQVNKAMKSEYGSLSYTPLGPYPGGIEQCGSSSNPDYGCSDSDSDSNAAYVQAVLWYVTGNQTYATNSINIMNAYSSGFKGYAGYTSGLPCPSGTTCSNGPLQAAWDAEKWPRAAEIIRYGNNGSAGWSSADSTAFANMLTNIFVPIIYNGSSSNGNWEMSMIEGMMGIAVFTENSALLAHAQAFWLQRVPADFYYQPQDGDTQPPFPAGRQGSSTWYGQVDFNTTTTGVTQETCRDLKHTEDSIAAAINAAETDWIQGGTLYTNSSIDAQPRIVGTMNLIAGLESDGSPNSVIAAPADFCTGSAATDENEITLGVGTTYVIGYNEYHNRLNDPNMADASGTTGLHGTANTYNWIQNGLLPQSLSSDQGVHMALFEALTHTAIPASSNFSLTASPGSQTVTAGSSASYTATVAPSNGFTGTVTLSASGLPSGATASFSPTSISGGTGSSTLTVTTTSSTPAGTSTLTITGTSGTLTQTASVSLTVTPAPTTATPTFSPVAGSYTSAQTVTISDATSGAKIYYTTNGTTPTTSSPLYSGPITVSSTETLEAIAAATGDNNSAVATAVYTIIASSEAPYGGTPVAIPGMVKAENYDTGGQGVAYNVPSVNGTDNSYRSDGVNLETTTATGGGNNLGWAATGQWFKFTVNVATAGTYTVTFEVASNDGATDAFHLSNSAGTNLTGSINVPNTGGWETWKTVTATVTLPAGTQVLTLNEDNPEWNIYSATFALVPSGGPYGGTAAAIPGKVLTENYDLGGQGIGYNVTSANGTDNSYRTDGVDLETTTATGGGNDLGWAKAGQWFKYTVNVATAGTYTVTFEVASNDGATGAFHLSNSAGINLTGAVNVPNTGGWETWATVTATVTLPAGTQTLTLNEDNPEWNIYSATFAFVPSEAPYGGAPAAISGIVKAENYDTGGQGVAYNVTSVNGTDNSYRSDGVNLETTTATGGGNNLGWAKAGQWFKYTVNVATAGTYTVTFEIASNNGATDAFHLSNSAGANLTGSVNVPDTGGWETWKTVTATVTLPAGTQVLTLNEDNPEWNIYSAAFALQ